MGAEEQIFKRYEIKYLLSGEQYRELQQRLHPYLTEDTYGETEICNCYYDTPDFRLIRNSLEKPVYKEKLRMRSYGTPKDGKSRVYLELKKKFQGVVYKRREQMSLEQASNMMNGKIRSADTQILREIEWFCNYYQNLYPVMYVSYHRIALLEKEKKEEYSLEEKSKGFNLRVTFDWDIRWRTEEVDLDKGNYGNSLLLPEQRIMEIKTLASIPKWLADILDEMEIFPSSCSKYGKAYEQWKHGIMKEDIA